MNPVDVEQKNKNLWIHFLVIKGQNKNAIKKIIWNGKKSDSYVTKHKGLLLCTPPKLGSTQQD